MPDSHVDRSTSQVPSLHRLFDQAAECAARGDWASAERAVVRLQAVAPDSVPVLMLATLVMLRLGRYRDAHRCVLQAARLPADASDTLLQVARWLHRFEEFEALERLVAGSDWRAIRSLPLLIELAQLLGSAGLYALAQDCVSHALKISPRHTDAHYLRGLFEMFSGNTEASIEALMRALSIDPRMANAHGLLSMQQDRRSAEWHIAAMRNVLPVLRPGSKAQAHLFYALHHRLDAVGQHEEAWQMLERGWAVMRRITPYQHCQQEALFSALKNMVLPAFQPDQEDTGGTGLIFIVGMFRSGTTLIERVLAGHPDVADGGESYLVSACMRDATDHDGSEVVDDVIVTRACQADFNPLRRRLQAYASWRARGRRWLTEKLPANFLNLGFILHALPEARILHMRRDPIDTCFSNLRILFHRAAPYACDQQDMADYYLQYRSLMAHWHAVAPGRILDVDYEAFVADPDAQARRVMAHCGLPYAPEALDLGRQGGKVATASAASVRKGILRNRGGAWKPYEQVLQPMIRGLQATYAAGID